MHHVSRLTTLFGLAMLALTSVTCSSDNETGQGGTLGGSGGSGGSAGKGGSTGKGGSNGKGTAGSAGSSSGGAAGADGMAGAAGEQGGGGDVGSGGAGGDGTSGDGGASGSGSGGASGSGSGGASGSGSGGDGGAADGGSGGAAGDGASGAGGAGGDDGCVIGEVSSDATANNLSLFGTPVYFDEGAALAAGTYEVTFLDGCMRYGSGQGWTVNAYTEAGCCNWWMIGATTSNLLFVLPGTVGYAVGSGAFSAFDECVAASQAAAPITFEHAGGPLGIWLRDSPYDDNSAGVDGRNPKWRLRRLGECL